MGGGAPDFCKKLIKAWFNRGEITTLPLVLQREWPRTAGGTLLIVNVNIQKVCERFVEAVGAVLVGSCSVFMLKSGYLCL